MNPLLEKFNTPFETAPFDKIKVEHYLPAMKVAIEKGKAEVDAITAQTESPTFENTVLALENSGELVNTISSIFFNLNSAETNDEIQALAREISPLLTDYSNDITLNAALFSRIEYVFKNEDQSKFTEEQKTLLSKSYKGFVRNGAALSEDKKDELRKIDKELSQLSLAFGENVLAENNNFELLISDENELAGLPDSAKEAAKMMAKQKEYEGWLFTLDYPSYIPFMTYADNAQLREKMYRAFTSKSFKGDEFDNQNNVKRIAQLRYERAKLLGYKTHADFVLEERMAGSFDTVSSFLNNIFEHALPAAKAEVEELTAYAKKNGGPAVLQKWDTAYWSEKLKDEKYAINDELLKPYFQLEKVVDGVFQVAQKLYGLSFVENKDIPVYHKEVTAYEVKDENGKHVSVFYADFFPRKGKRQGAWMTSYRSQKMNGSVDQRPHISNVCNFTKPTDTKPSLLTFNEVTTLFHEFGHGLHGMLAKGNYASLSGTSVFWDFVELPSQIFENWCYEKECLDLFARHYETNEAIPQDLIDKIKKAANFQGGMQSLRQVHFGLLDMAWHANEITGKEDVATLEGKAGDKTELFPKVEGSNMSCQFSHIFQGGYSSGYYSYKWAEVLDADAFEAFLEKGIFNKEVADSFRENILSAGGTEHPMILYKRFRGQEPDPKALLRRAGLIQ